MFLKYFIQYDEKSPKKIKKRNKFVFLKDDIFKE